MYFKYFCGKKYFVFVFQIHLQKVFCICISNTFKACILYLYFKYFWNVFYPSLVSTNINSRFRCCFIHCNICFILCSIFYCICLNCKFSFYCMFILMYYYCMYCNHLRSVRWKLKRYLSIHYFKENSTSNLLLSTGNELIVARLLCLCIRLLEYVYVHSLVQVNSSALRLSTYCYF